MVLISREEEEDGKTIGKGRAAAVEYISTFDGAV